MIDTNKVTPLTPAHVASIRAAVATLLAGGPYRPEYPVPEGTSCTLSLAAAGGAPPFFQIGKSNANEADAVTALLRALTGS